MPYITSTPTTTMAVAATEPGPPEAATSFVACELELPPLGEHDLLVEVRAVAVNPVDLKLLRIPQPGRGPRVLGHDAAGVVVAVGSGVSRYRAGDEVYYAGTIDRAGANARLHVVEERLAGRKPASIGFADAAALPLSTITAWESLFLHLGLQRRTTGHLLVVGAAGGIGSMVTQLALNRSNVSVIAAASRPQAAEWSARMGAHHVISRSQLTGRLDSIAPAGVDWIVSSYSTGMIDAFARVLKVGGTVVAVDDVEGLDVTPLKPKSQAWRWEAMFSGPRFEPGTARHREILDAAASLVDSGAVTSPVTTTLTGFIPGTFRDAYRLVESGTSVGKTVIAVS